MDRLSRFRISVASSIRTASKISPDAWIEMTQRIVNRVCAKRNCRIGFRNGILIEIEGMLVELREAEGLDNSRWMEIECVAEHEKHLLICMDIVLKAAEEALKVEKSSEVVK